MFMRFRSILLDGFENLDHTSISMDSNMEDICSLGNKGIKTLCKILKALTYFGTNQVSQGLKILQPMLKNLKGQITLEFTRSQTDVMELDSNFENMTACAQPLNFFLLSRLMKRLEIDKKEFEIPKVSCDTISYSIGFLLPYGDKPLQLKEYISINDDKYAHRQNNVISIGNDTDRETGHYDLDDNEQSVLNIYKKNGEFDFAKDLQRVLSSITMVPDKVKTVYFDINDYPEDEQDNIKKYFAHSDYQDDIQKKRPVIIDSENEPSLALKCLLCNISNPDIEDGIVLVNTLAWGLDFKNWKGVIKVFSRYSRYKTHLLVSGYLEVLKGETKISR